MDGLAYWVALHQVPGIGARRFKQLVDYFGSAYAVWQAGESALRLVPGIPPTLVESLLKHRSQINPEQKLEEALTRGFSVLSLADPDYPANLRTIYDPPPVLYVKGQIRPEDSQALAIVGSRKATPYGKAVAEKLGEELAAAGFCIISGLARGIDTCSHVGALRGSGRTIAVLGSGLDIVYPRENLRLFEKIVEHGAVISEFPVGTPPEPVNFPSRNRIISGLARGVIVVEATKNSGALITSDFALEQGRDVFAVPGPITSRYSVGTNRLIKQGAKLIESVEDVLEEYVMPTLFSQVDTTTGKEIPVKLTQEEQELLENISFEPITKEKLIILTGKSSQEVSTRLMFLELKGMVRQLPGQLYILSQRQE
ncbi:MAG: DNA-protecting protein DprA [Firmicutes bacterium]|nr:DNA-protecting protein DprA [Bacillota bacterium]